MDIEKMRICFVGNMLGRNPGYVTTQGQIVADLFAKEGYEVTCVSSKINRVARLAEIVSTLVVKRANFDAVVLDVYSGLSFIIADVVSTLCKFLRLPLVMVLRGGNLPKFVSKHPRRTKRTLGRSTFLVAPSDFLATAIGQYGFDIRVIPNVLDIGNYPFRERRNIGPRLIWMRSFHPIYNPQMAVEVLEELRKDYPGATLVMAGNDKGLEEEVRILVEKKNLSGAVSIVGFLDQAKKIEEFAQADVYINTNRVDNMPVSLVEACAFGLPVVATRVGGIPFLIDHRDNGMLVPGEDVGAMAGAIRELLADTELTRRISLGARQLAERSAWSRVRREWEELLTDIRYSPSDASTKVEPIDPLVNTTR